MGVERGEKRRDLGIPHLLLCQGISGLPACSPAPGDVSGLILPLLQMRKWGFRGITRLGPRAEQGLVPTWTRAGGISWSKGRAVSRVSPLIWPPTPELFPAAYALCMPSLPGRLGSATGDSWNLLPGTRTPSHSPTLRLQDFQGGSEAIPASPRGAQEPEPGGPGVSDPLPPAVPRRTQADPRVLPAAGGPWEPRAAFAAGAGRSAGSRREGLGDAATGWG